MLVYSLNEMPAFKMGWMTLHRSFLFLSGGKNMPAKPRITKYAKRMITIIVQILPKESMNL